MTRQVYKSDYLKQVVDSEQAIDDLLSSKVMTDGHIVATLEEAERLMSRVGDERRYHSLLEYFAAIKQRLES